jgi:hypothetical protein
MPGANELAMRDSALAAIFGLTDESDFGAEDFASQFSRLSADSQFGYEPYKYRQSYVGAEFGGSFGEDAAPMGGGIPKPTPQAALALWQKHHMNQAAAANRELLLDPNRDSQLKVEKYIFQLVQSVVMGTATALALINNPSTTIRPKRMVMNAPVPGFAEITSVAVANVNVSVGGTQSFDAFFVSAQGVGVELDLPTLTPANQASIVGTTSILVPLGYVPAATFRFSVAFIGPSQLAG